VTVGLLLVAFLAALFAGALVLVRQNVLDHLEGVEAEMEHERGNRRMGVEVLHRRCDDIREQLDAALEQFEFTRDLVDGRASLNSESHSEFRNRLDIVESRLDHTVKAVADNFKQAQTRAKRSK
jgi:hypothetical protein